MSKDQPGDITKKARSYLEKHQLEEIISDMINTLAHHQCAKPIVYMIKYLSLIHCTKQELEENGIHIDHYDDSKKKEDGKDKIEKPMLCLPMPQFPNNFTGQTVRKHLEKKEVFFACKNEFTPYGNNFRSLQRLILENPKHKVGLFATDPGCYRTYESLFEPVIKEKGWNYTPSKELRYQLNTDVFDRVSAHIDDCTVVLRRNYANQRFNATLQDRDQLTKDLITLLEKQQIVNYSQKVDLKAAANEDIKKFQVDKVQKGKPNNQGAATATLGSLFKDGRHPDWPSDRALLLTADKQHIAWINREDHLKFKFYKSDKHSFLELLDKAVQMSDYLQNYSSFDDKYGYTTVKPMLSGVGLTFTIRFKFDSNSSQTQSQQQYQKIKQNAANLKKDPSKAIFNVTSSESKTQKHIAIKLTQCAGYNLQAIVDNLAQAIATIFELPIQQPNPQPAHVVINVPEKMQEEYQDYLKYHHDRLKLLPKTPFSICIHLRDLSDSIKSDGLYLNEKIVSNKFLLVRRNLQAVNFNLETLKVLHQYEKTDNAIIERVGLEMKKCSVYKRFYKQYGYHLMLKYDDDFTFVFPLEQNSVSQLLKCAAKIVGKFMSEINLDLAFSSDLGYLTNQNEYIGTGVSLVVQFNQPAEALSEKLKNELNRKQITQKNQFMCINHFTEQSYQIFSSFFNNQFTMDKKLSKDSPVLNNQVTDMDCSYPKLWAPKRECFQEFQSMYEEYLREVVQLFRNLQIEPKLFDNHRNYAFAFIPEKLKMKIKCTFYRNFNRYNYVHEMTQSEKAEAKKVILRQYQRLLQCESQQKDQDQLYRVKINKVHHLQVEFTVFVNDFIRAFEDCWNMLKDFNQLEAFQHDANLGYLGPDIQQSFCEGFQLEISVQKKRADLAEKYKYIMEDLNDQVVLRSDRPCNFAIEFSFISQYLDL